MGAEPKECTPQRLTSLRSRAKDALITAAPEFSAEAARLRKERRCILIVTVVLVVIIVAVSSLIKFDGWSDIVKSVLGSGGSGGLVIWVVTVAFRRMDHESQLNLFPKFFAVQFDLCHDCEAYERVFERFAIALDRMRGAG